MTWVFDECDNSQNTMVSHWHSGIWGPNLFTYIKMIFIIILSENRIDTELWIEGMQHSLGQTAFYSITKNWHLPWKLISCNMYLECTCFNVQKTHYLLLHYLHSPSVWKIPFEALSFYAHLLKGPVCSHWSDSTGLSKHNLPFLSSAYYQINGYFQYVLDSHGLNTRSGVFNLKQPNLRAK